jgi:hypothetical protein
VRVGEGAANRRLEHGSFSDGEAIKVGSVPAVIRNRRLSEIEGQVVLCVKPVVACVKNVAAFSFTSLRPEREFQPDPPRLATRAKRTARRERKHEEEPENREESWRSKPASGIR